VGGGEVGRIGSECHQRQIGREERVVWQGFCVVTNAGYAANAKGPIAFLPPG
jgi:hypothetical protein